MVVSDNKDQSDSTMKKLEKQRILVHVAVHKSSVITCTVVYVVQ